MDVSLRPAVLTDMNFLWEVHCNAMKPYVSELFGWNEDFQKRYFEEHYNPEKTSIILVDETQVGMIRIDESPLGYMLTNLEILKEYQGQGVGRMLIRDLIQKADANGLPVTLKVLRNNPAKTLYELMGFRTISETETHFCMRKENLPIEFLPKRWSTDLCFMDEFQAGDLPQLVTILEENQEAATAFGKAGTPEDQAANIVRGADLEFSWVPWREKIYLIRDPEVRDTMGFLEVYFGYPTDNAYHIRSLYLRKAFQGRRFGRAVIQELERRAKDLGFEEAHVRVGLKNWKAMRFWTINGFDRITYLPSARKGDTKPIVKLVKSLTE